MDYKKKYLKYKAKYLNIKKQIKGGDAGRTYGQDPQTGRAKRTQSGQSTLGWAASTIAAAPENIVRGTVSTIASAPGAVMTGTAAAGKAAVTGTAVLTQSGVDIVTGLMPTGCTSWSIHSCCHTNPISC